MLQAPVSAPLENSDAMQYQLHLFYINKRVWRSIKAVKKIACAISDKLDEVAKDKLMSGLVSSIHCVND